MLIKYAREHEIPIIKEDLKEAPLSGDLWIERGRNVFGVRTNPYGNITTDFVYDTVVKALKGMDLSGLVITKTHLSTNVNPAHMNKRSMAQTAMKLLDPHKSFEKWYAFGDSDMDRLMKEADPEKIGYFDVRGRAADGVLEYMERILG